MDSNERRSSTDHIKQENELLKSEIKGHKNIKKTLEN